MRAHLPYPPRYDYEKGVHKSSQSSGRNGAFSSEGSFLFSCCREYWFNKHKGSLSVLVTIPTTSDPKAEAERKVTRGSFESRDIFTGTDTGVPPRTDPRTGAIITILLTILRGGHKRVDVQSLLTQAQMAVRHYFDD